MNEGNAKQGRHRTYSPYKLASVISFTSFSTFISFYPIGYYIIIRLASMGTVCSEMNG